MNNNNSHSNLQTQTVAPSAPNNESVNDNQFFAIIGVMIVVMVFFVVIYKMLSR